ncbi:MAG: hypothetical protein ACXACY_27835 [Candidatus Hodarchaeales archaeon]|jgi:predicted small secreted protein
MIEKIGAVIALIIGIFSFGYLKGKDNERNKSRKRAIKVVKKAKKIKKDIDNASPSDNRTKLRKWSRK